VHSDDGTETSTLDFDLVLRLELLPSDALDTLGIGSVEVLRHEGVDRYQYRSDPPEVLRLASTSIAGRGHTVNLHRAQGDGKISAVVFPLISVGLEWSGEAGFVPPETADVQAVTAEDESQEARFEKLADHLETIVDGAQEGNVSDYAQVMQAFSHLSAAQLRPDHEVVQGDGLSYCAGKGEFEQELEDLVVRRTFEWELFLDR
jgi:hypothetical protein